eukprot:maker-scaffold140_size315649-snap-gene-2.27 protein:Tk03585 transcript:maker-scaffold140_size315649-snap-gene-2.27-mRNA-1 annotation:"solute carrier family 22 member 6-a-like"
MMVKVENCSSEHTLDTIFRHLTKIGCKIYQRSYTDLDEAFDPDVWKDCQHWEYDQSQFSRTIISDWNLVCEDAYFGSLSQTVYFMGQLLGILTCGILADILGRKSVLITMTVSLGIFAALNSYVTSFTGFLILRFANAFCMLGAYEGMFSYLAEIASGNWISVMTQGFFIFWPLGWTMLAPIAYYVNDWRDLNMITALPNFIILILYWVIPESPKWLLATGRKNRAEKAVRKIDLINGQHFHFHDGWELEVKVEEDTNKPVKHSGMVWDLFRYPVLRAKMSVLLGNWLVIAMTYYGLSLNSGQFGGNIFINYVITGLVEIPAYMSSMLFMNVFGRRWTLSISLIIAGTILVSIIGIDQDLWNGWPIMGMVFVGKGVISIAFGTIYSYTAELCPTIVRSTGIGFSSCISRLGPMVAPWIGMLERYHPCIPLIIWGLMAIVGGVVAIVLPDTNGMKLPDTFEESEAVPLIVPSDRNDQYLSGSSDQVKGCYQTKHPHQVMDLGVVANDGKKIPHYLLKPKEKTDGVGWACQLELSSESLRESLPTRPSGAMNPR